MVEIKQTLVGKLESKLSLSGKLNNAIEKIYPELEDIVITPSAEEQIFTSTKYGFENVTVKGIEGIVEDLSEELTEQDSLLITQEITIENIITALEGKSAGGGLIPKVEGNTLILSGAKVEGGVLSI